MLKVCVIILIGGVCCSAFAQSNSDETMIRNIAGNWDRAWNKHDMKELFDLVTLDADFVNVGARHWKGRKEIEAQHTLRLGQFKESTFTTKSVTVQFLKPDIALVHANWAMSGDKDPDGTPRKPREGVFTWIVVKQKGKWLIRAAQNTNAGNLPSPVAPKPNR